MTKRLEQDRISRLKQRMEENGLDSLLITRREDVRYLSGFTGSSGALLVASGRSCLITDFRYKLQAMSETSGLRIIIQKKDFSAALREAVTRLEVDTLWVDESAITVEGMKNFKRQGFKLKGNRDLVRTLRQRKDKQELSNIRTAISRAEESFRELQHAVKPGATERELGLKLEYLMREKGARKAAFDTIVASGVHGAMPHASVTNRRIRNNDLVTFDFGAEANGYYSDMTRTFCVGRPTARQREIHALVLQAQACAIRSIRVGIACKSVDGAAREVITRAGHGKHFGHGTGHGIGLMVHEGPAVSSLSKDLVEQGMVFTVEPGVYIAGWGGVRVEDMVLVTDTGAKVLTTLPREIEGLTRC